MAISTAYQMVAFYIDEAGFLALEISHQIFDDEFISSGRRIGLDLS